MHDSPTPWTKIEVERQVRPAGVSRRDVLPSATTVHRILSGRMRIAWRHGHRTVGEGALLWVPGGMRTSQDFPTQTTMLTVRLRIGAWAAHSEADRDVVELMRRLSRCVRSSGPVLSVTPATDRRILTHLEDLARVWAAPDLNYHRCALKAGAVELLVMLMQDRRINRWMKTSDAPSTQSIAAQKVAPALELLNRQRLVAQPDVAVDDLAAACGYGVSRFHELFLEATGTTPQRYLTERRITLACELLGRPHRSILDVALASGFGTQSRFYAAFKQVTGLTPGQYRRSHQPQDEPA